LRETVKLSAKCRIFGAVAMLRRFISHALRITIEMIEPIGVIPMLKRHSR
jgi:hypothetical protein